MKIFDELDKEYDQCVIDKKSLEIENKNLLIQNECLLAESVSKDISSIVLTSDIIVPMSVEPRSNCVKEHSRNLELEAEILKLKEELTTVRIKHDSLRDENVSIKKRYQDLYKSKAECNSNVSSGAVVPEKPKVLAPGLYAMTPKYVPPLKRNNREVNTPLPTKETISLVKKPNVSVNLSTRIKSVTKASKSKSRCETKTHRNLSARSEKVKRVENLLRNLNKMNRVDFSLSVKSTSFISKSVSVCIICCSRHMTGDRSKLINYVEKSIGTVRFRNDQFAAIVGYGQFCDTGQKVAFRKYTCYIRNKDKVDLLKGSRTTNQYSISLKDVMEASPVCLLSKASSTKSWLWHRRLNHLNFGTLNELARKDLVRGLPKLKYEKEHLCPSCQLGKIDMLSVDLLSLTKRLDIGYAEHELYGIVSR
nr:hypothetical protein [Tanacetum cinerariifolium]